MLERDNLKKEQEIYRLQNRVEDLEEALKPGAGRPAVIRGVPSEKCRPSPAPWKVLLGPALMRPAPPFTCPGRSTPEAGTSARLPAYPSLAGNGRAAGRGPQNDAGSGWRLPGIRWLYYWHPPSIVKGAAIDSGVHAPWSRSHPLPSIVPLRILARNHFDFFDDA